MRKIRIRQRLGLMWQALTIKKKIITFTGLVFMTITLSVLFDVWVVKFSLIDFNTILEDNVKCSTLVQTLQEEQELFESYVKNPDDEKGNNLEMAMQDTQKAVYDLPFSYRKIGEERYAKTWSIRSSYEVYEQRRDGFLAAREESADYINRLYEVYDMQSYLQSYAGTLMTDTLESGNEVYQRKVPGLMHVPAVVLIFGACMLWGMVKLSGFMYRTLISPIMELAKTSKRIAANDFFVEDVSVSNQDELGELVRAFNKMKYATGEYILALEEKRKTLDLLHEEELEKLEVEKRLETMKLELLKSQINPHFLFNTLNVIGGMANLEEAATTEKMIKTLSSLFRYNLKTTEVEVPLAQELKVVTDYMYLQQMRFGSRISYCIDCKVDEKLVMVPAFTFQPLVENAILHGLSKKEEGGAIRIRIWQQDGVLFITISDTGAGMDQKELQRLKGELWERDGGNKGIGLGNIYQRILAMYEGSSFEIFSRKQVGTVIRIKIL